uniref:Exosome component 10 n=1 Tax=Lygus hesperus TaxID=30085 RepID=A0A0A9Z1D5_LYGHE
MQISSRFTDYVIDCIQLRNEMHRLAPLFLNNKILKVLHGAREDVRWLQKDFGLYLVNFFDTGIALQTLHMPHSLAFAVDHFCQVKLDKKYQTADWRVRPLPAEMVHYARCDTHYLLYIYDRLQSLLMNSESRGGGVGNLLLHVYQESQRLALEQYVKPVHDDMQSYKVFLGRSLAGLNGLQEKVAREVYN